MVPVVTVELEHADQFVIGDGGEDHAHDHGGRRIAVGLQKVSEGTTGEHQVDVEFRIAQTERAEDREGHQARDEDARRHGESAGHAVTGADGHRHHEKLRYDGGDDQAVDQRNLFIDQVRSRLQALHGQRAQQHRRGHAARHTENQGRHQGSAGTRVVGAFAGDDAVGIAGAEGFRSGRQAPGEAVGGKRRQRRAGRRNEAHRHTQKRRPAERRQMAERMAETLDDGTDITLYVDRRVNHVIAADQHQQFGNHEHANEDRDYLYALGQERVVEGGAPFPCRHHADGADEQPKRTRGIGLESRAAAHGPEHGDAGDGDEENFSGPELERCGGHRADADQHDDV